METNKNTVEDIEINEAFDSLPVVTKGVSVDQIALMEPKRAAEVVQSRIDALETIRKAAIKATKPEDWVGFKDGDGNVNYILASSGAVKVRKPYGISTYKLYSDEPEIYKDDNDVMVAKIVGDGYCALTGEVALRVMGLRKSDEHFTGRGSIEDLKQSARTSLETKIVRILAGMTRVSEEELIAYSIDIKKTRKGSGFGTSSERKADKVVDEKTKKLREQLADKLTKYTAGDTAKAAKILKQITANPPKFDGFDSLKKLTQDWQVKQAIEKLEILMSEGGAE